MDYVIALALGLLGSLHCAAMCGPLMLALPVAPGGAGRFIAGRVLYQSGRITTYACLGIIAGLVGKSVLLAGMQRWLSITLGATILLGFLLSKRMALSAPVVRLVGKLKTAMGTQLQQRTFRSLTLLGMLNGLLPCGLVYVALAGAVARGTMAQSVLWMLAFGFGTLPTMLGISLSGKIFPVGIRMKFRRAVPAGVLLLAGLLILRGLALGIPYVSPNLDMNGCCLSH
jgi:hypothetical protein